MKPQIIHAGQAILAASLFGASTPLIKLLLDEVQPVQMASFLYLGSAVGLFFFDRLKRLFLGETATEARLTGRDIPWLLGATLSGGIVAPVLLTFSLKVTPAATASLLLNSESAATALLAAILFREAIGRSVWVGIVLITLAGVALSLDGGGRYGFSPGAAGILSACAFWGLDNNLTRHISSKNPATIVTVKGIIAGTFLLIASLVMGCSMPGLLTLFLSLIVGLCCYGCSIVFFIHAMRGLGSARTGAYYALAPFIGSALSFAVFQELPGAFFLSSLPLFAAGVVLLFSERHVHQHQHTEVEHEHSHSHNDGHHEHRHIGGEGNREHAHLHRHECMVHAHAHTPDIHHRHAHRPEKTA
jgi:drug/metabolite transporter (DMT)-like permease